MNTIKVKHAREYILFFLIFLNIFSFINRFIFDLYMNWALWGNLIFILFIYFLQNSISKYDLINILFLFLFLFYLVFTIFVTGRGLNDVVLLINSILIFFVISKENLSFSILKKIFVLSLFMFVFLIVRSINYLEFYRLYSDNYINPNNIGYLIFITSLYINILGNIYINKFLKIKLLIINMLTVFGLYNVHSRSSLIGFLFFIILNYVLHKKIWKTKLFTIILYILIIIFGFLFPYTYSKFFVNYNIRLLSGRGLIWANFFREYTMSLKSIMFGIREGVSFFYKKLSLHNSYLNIMKSFGVGGYFLYFLYFMLIIKESFNRKLSDIQISFLLGFFSIMIVGFVEINVYSFRLALINFLFIAQVLNSNLSHNL